MKGARKVALVLLATALAVAGMVAPALANTELIPGSRLIWPYIDIQSGRETFLLITNSGFSAPSVHIEFYAQNCDQTDRPVFLTSHDIAAIQVSKAVSAGFFKAVSGNAAQQNVAGIGYADADVRFPCGSSSLISCAGVEYNGLMGIGVILDIPGNFAFAYPAAASQGSAESGMSSTTLIIDGNTVNVPESTLVSRDGSGRALLWSGAYETYPSTMMIPAFFAEDLCSASSPTLTAFISIVAPADAWRKEAPSQTLGTGTVLVNLTNSGACDGEENCISINAAAHMVNGRLCTVFGDSIKARTEYDTTPGQYATSDSTLGSKNAVGWLELSNTVLSPTSSTTGPAPNPNFKPNVVTSGGTPDSGKFDTSLRPRGMVGLVFEIQKDDFLSFTGATGTVRTADAIRTWGDPATQIDWPCFGTAGTGGISPPTLASGANAPRCDDNSGRVNPGWAGDHAATLNGRYDSGTRGQAP
jgi:hypothetical protein